jgi:hypothetical protein
VVDRVAVVIGKKVITESEVLEELRLTEFLNNQPLDLGPAARRTAAEHLVDQQLIRQEIENSGYAKPAASEADALLRSFRRQRFPTDAEYQVALEKYGITEEELKQRLLWQATALQFTDLRFRSQLPEVGPPSADRAATETESTSVDQQMDAWLKQARASAKIVFKQEAFQ